jgi:reticulon-4-interacting protein 1, mitochondrial
MADAKSVWCLGPGQRDPFALRPVDRLAPRRGEIEVAVEAAAVNPIDLRRAEGYGARLLRLKGAGRFPLVLGNDFAGTVSAVGSRVTKFALGDPVFGAKPPSRNGTHASHVVVDAEHAILAPAVSDLRSLAALPYSFTTMWRALQDAGLNAGTAPGKAVLVHGAAGGLGTLALQLLAHWGARVTAIAAPEAAPACTRAGAIAVIDRSQLALRTLERRFDASLNFATWDDDRLLVAALRSGALGHATTVHPLLGSIDRLGLVRGLLSCLAEKRSRAATLPVGTRRYAWTVFSPDPQALAELRRQVEAAGTSLPIGCAVPLEQAGQAFHHVRSRQPGRALLLPGARTGQ